MKTHVSPEKNKNISVAYADKMAHTKCLYRANDNA